MTHMKTVAPLFSTIIFTLFLHSCGSIGTESIAKEYFATCLADESQNILQLSDFTKTNGFDSKGPRGESIFVIEFKAVIKPTQTVRKAFCGNLEQEWCWDNLRVVGMYKHSRNPKLVKGEDITLIGKIYLRKTDNGWRAEEYKINSGG